jgi:hypothetical protein
VSDADHQLLARLESFLRRETGTQRLGIAPETDLVRHLGVDGSDGVDLMRKYGEGFQVDMSGFRPGDYFGPEGSFNPFAIFFLSWWRRRRALPPLLVEDLVRVARTRRWLAAARYHH